MRLLPILATLLLLASAESFALNKKSIVLEMIDAGIDAIQDFDSNYNIGAYTSIFASDVTCKLCGASLAPVHFFLENGLIRRGLEFIVTELCEILKVENGIPTVCKGAINTMADFLLPALSKGPFSKQEICDEKLQLCTSPHITKLKAQDYVDRVIGSKPAIIQDNHYVDNIYAKIAARETKGDIVRSIQFSDLHIDFAYQEGMPAQCDYPICCRNNGKDTRAKPGSRLAGFWGDYDCDIPQRTLDAMFDWVGKHQDILNITFLTWVGDNSGHNIWSNTDEEITNYTIAITDMMKERMGGLGIDFFPIQGNHDTWPVNVESFSVEYGNQALNGFGGFWDDEKAGWLTFQQVDKLKQFGFYSKPMKHNPNGTVIALNTQACNDLNWYLLAEREDPGKQIAWLEAELDRIEKADGFAYIISHIPPHLCLHQFGIRYKALMERYQHIVRWQSYGHTHSETFYFTQAENTEKPIGWTLITGSGTSGDYRNPAFTIVDWDAEYMVPVNVHTFITNLTEANANPDKKPEFFELHDWLQEYNLTDMSPSSMKKFSERLYNDAELAAQYEWNQDRRGSARPAPKAHTLEYLCYKASETFERKRCMGEPEINLKSFESTDWFEYLIGDWIEVSQ